MKDSMLTKNREYDSVKLDKDMFLNSDRNQSLASLAGEIIHLIASPMCAISSGLPLVKNLKPFDFKEARDIINNDLTKEEVIEKISSLMDKWERSEEKRQQLLDLAIKGGDKCSNIIEGIRGFIREVRQVQNTVSAA